MATSVLPIINTTSTSGKLSLMHDHHNNQNKNQEIIDRLLELAKQEQERGNKSVTEDKLNKLSQFLAKQSEAKSSNSVKEGQSFEKFNKLPSIPKPKYSPFFNKFDLHKSLTSNTHSTTSSPNTSQILHKDKKPLTFKKPASSKFSLKKLEHIVIQVLENLANLLDNLHLFSRLPMFPPTLLSLLKQTNKLWVLILVFLIRKTISQLINVIKKENKIKIELSILNQSSTKKNLINNDVNKKYNKVLKDLKFDKMMLILELVGNFLDLTFNSIELWGIIVPDWFMSVLNFSSMAMTIYRMNKDDEYVDDDITEDLI
ncbi:hypothetical protein DFJ63DRAFT_256090 [Scheffersomyces coipomensis]|uniref:uncharacterized protein n=1 Tax=Scheffersomyces coipomensis TaxID=1788519 RepID=UPI00315D9676